MSAPDEETTEAAAKRALDSILSGRDRGPLLTFEVTWANGHVEHVEGHQCLTPNPLGMSMYGSPSPAPRWTIHGEFDGVWQLVLSARDDDIRTVRNLTRETAPGSEAET